MRYYTTNGLFAALIVITAIQLTSGCKIIHGDPWMEIVVTQIDRDLSFEFFVREKSWWTIRRGKIPAEVLTLTVGDSEDGSTIWQIDSRNSRKGVKRITYGIVPENFSQISPHKGEAPTLVSGKQYEVLAYGDGFGVMSFTYQ